MTAALVLILALAGQKFLGDDPILLDDDAAIEVKEIVNRKLSPYYDFVQHTFARPGDSSKARAANVNTLGEVPNSSWFVNRHGMFSMTVDELVRGPNTGEGPFMGGPWAVIDAKTEGITPGFRIRDSRGDVYLIKFDPRDYPELATAAEVISTKFFHAIGYNVPENYVAFFKRDRVRVDPKARITGAKGRKRPMTVTDLDEILGRVYRQSDGTYRVVASKLLSGTPVGPFQYFGTRPDDPNDIFPHENRRELRGLSVFSAWLNHDDSRAINSLDMIVNETSRGKPGRHVKHYLIDFGSTLGSGSVGPQKPRAGWEYFWEPKAVLGRALTLGLWDREWVRVSYPKYTSVGRFESKYFEAQNWKPEYPNPAFLNTTDEDAYWAAKIVMSFTDEQISAMVKTGELSDPEAESYLIRTLIERRDKIGKYWLARLPSFDRFRLTPQGALEFVHLASAYDFARPPEYQLSWSRFDNVTGHKSSIETFVPELDEGYFVAEIESGEGRVDVYVRSLAGKAQIVGIER